MTVEAATTYLITSPQSTSEPRRRPQPAERPTQLTDDEILTEHAGTIWSALTAFGTDPAYLTEMCEVANLVERKRDLWHERHAS